MSAFITIVTPSYNQARFLDQTLRSVISQRAGNDQYFVIDDGSTDNSVEVIRRWEARIDYWTTQKNAGQARVIAQGFERAAGDILYWLNSDDILLPGALSRVRDAFDRHPDWDVLTGYHVRIDADSRILSAHRIPGESRRMTRWGVHHIAQMTCFFRRELYQRIGPIDPSLQLTLDTELWLRMFRAGAKWGHIPHYLAAYRLHPAAKTSSRREVLAREGEELRRRYPDYCAASTKHALGRFFYRTLQVASGRAPRAAWETRHWKGRLLEDVFPSTAREIASPQVQS